MCVPLRRLHHHHHGCLLFRCHQEENEAEEVSGGLQTSVSYLGCCDGADFILKLIYAISILVKQFFGVYVLPNIYIIILLQKKKM